MDLFKKALQIVGAIAIIFTLVFAVTSTDNSNSLNSSPLTKNTNHLKALVTSLPIPSDLSFAGEPVPLNEQEVLERVDREFLVNTYWQSNAMLLMKRSQKYFPIMRPILEAYGVPEDFLYLAVAESGLEPLRSPAGAAGFWQLMKGTAKDYKLEVNNNVDERYHVEKATAVACEYILKAKEKFGSWTLAAAAYNAGNRSISRQLEKQQTNSYYDLLLGQETGRYVFRILALKNIMSDLITYGFKLNEIDYYKLTPTKEVTIDEPIKNLSDFALTQNISYKILKRHNPWLRQEYLNNRSQKKYQIKIPLEID